MKIFRLLSKKIIVSITLLLLLGGALFAALAELELSTIVGPINELKITHGVVPTLATWTDTEITSELTELDTTPVSGIHLNLMTNLRKSITITMMIPHLSSEESSWKIPYTLKLAGSEDTFSSDDDESVYNFAQFPATDIEGRTILTTTFSLQLDKTAYDNAIAGSYEGVISFEIITD